MKDFIFRITVIFLLFSRPIHLETFHKMSIDIGKDLEKHKPNEATDAESDNDEDYQEEIVDCLEDVPSDMMVNIYVGISFG